MRQISLPTLHKVDTSMVWHSTPVNQKKPWYINMLILYCQYIYTILFLQKLIKIKIPKLYTRYNIYYIKLKFKKLKFLTFNNLYLLLSKNNLILLFIYFKKKLKMYIKQQKQAQILLFKQKTQIKLSIKINNFYISKVWGYVLTETSLQQNFNFGFSTHKSEILLHLSQWQYWWWFWFSTLWTLYYFITLRTLNKKILHFNPILNTSLRSHGKWGDFLVALIPLSWCINILINSNFILRMIEWQNESSLITLRVQGKQWYWVYKFDNLTAQSILSAPKNIGHNKWFINTPFESYTVNSYYEGVNLATNLEFLESYTSLLNDNKKNKIKLTQDLFLTDNINYKETKQYKHKINNTHLLSFTLINNNNTSHLINSIFDETSDFMGNLLIKQSKKPLKFIGGTLNKHNTSLLNTISKTDKLIFLHYILNTTNENFSKKLPILENLWGFRQKKYKKTDKFLFKSPVSYDPITYKPKDVLSDLKNLNPALLYKVMKYNRYRHELVPCTLARRLLRTKRTLVLPAYVNITIITNSYDVVHSWFIPGLGIKLDCVPGRSTHHTFYIDNIGFYYGQCAEICGRYHHHMPIRLCALPFDHFMVWWQTKGLPRINRLNRFNSKNISLKNKEVKVPYNYRLLQTN